MYYVYLLKSKKDAKFYTGCTSNLIKRLEEHGKNLVYNTKYRGPFVLLYYEACHNKKDAFNREKYLKTGMGKRFLKNRIKYQLSNLNF